jgi:hypothetical protein
VSDLLTESRLEPKEGTQRIARVLSLWVTGYCLSLGTDLPFLFCRRSRSASTAPQRARASLRSSSCSCRRMRSASCRPTTEPTREAATVVANPVASHKLDSELPLSGLPRHGGAARMSIGPRLAHRAARRHLLSITAV